MTRGLSPADWLDVEPLPPWTGSPPRRWLEPDLLQVVFDGELITRRISTGDECRMRLRRGGERVDENPVDR